jgi:hypothetical protein
MSAAEILYRVQHTALRPFDKNLSNNSEFSSQEGAVWLTVPKDIDPAPYTEFADNLLKGHITMFGVSKLELGHPPSWNKAVDYPGPYTDQEASRHRVEYADLTNDIKMLWEPSRHQHLVTFAQAYCLSGKQQYLDGLLTQLESWLDDCPYPSGPHWKSPMEAGIRLINWSVIWQLLGGKDSPAFKTDRGGILLHRWLLSINQHCHFVADNFSVYSSANNHRIGEAAGLFVASLSWPMWSDSEFWCENARSILVEEIVKQTYPDGSGKEQAFFYQQFVLDFFWISALAGKANGIEFPPLWWDRIEAMLTFIASVMDVKGNLPMIGDADSGYVVVLSREKGFSPFRSLMATGAVWYQRQDLLNKAGRIDDKTRWLLGTACETVKMRAEDKAHKPLLKHFPDGGYHILGSEFETDNEIQMLVDTGQLGYLSIAAHGHADALSIQLSIGGREFLVDPGTFAYNSDPSWRHYFRSTSAHNTLRVDKQNQSEYCGSFMWRKHAMVECLHADERKIVAAHNGYSRLADPVTHTREVAYNTQAKEYKITDTLNCNDTHIVEQHWHFSEHCEIEPSPDGFIAHNDGYSITLILDTSKMEVEVVQADEFRHLGWISREFGVRRRSTTIVCKKNITETTVLETLIICSLPGDV